MEQIIKKLTKVDVLNSFYNKHLEAYLSAQINIEVYKKIIESGGEKEVVAERQEILGQQPNGQPMMGIVKVKAIEALKEERIKETSQKRILDAIEQLYV